MGQRGRPTAQIVLSDDERETLERWAGRPKTGQALALRCRIVLLGRLEIYPVVLALSVVTLRRRLHSADS